MQAIEALLDAALAGGLGSACAVSIGDAGREVGRLVRGTVRRVPSAGPAIAESTAFDLASLTKPMSTAALAMALVGEGALALDAPIRRWFPAAAASATVAQLLGHAGGLAAHAELWRSLPADLGAARAALIDQAAAYPASPAGVTSVYSDLGYLLLGAIVERSAGEPLDQSFRRRIAEPLGLGPAACFPGSEPIGTAVATELDERGLVAGLVHDENAYFAGGVCGHAGLFAAIGDVAAFAQAIVDAVAGLAVAPWRAGIVEQFVTGVAAPDSTWRLGWDTPSAEPGVSHAGDRWPRSGALGHTGFTGTSLWLDLPHRRWVALLTNRVHPTRHGTADAIKALRRAVGDATCAMLDG